jgi:hypothetical protein
VRKIFEVERDASSLIWVCEKSIAVQYCTDGLYQYECVGLPEEDERAYRLP